MSTLIREGSTAKYDGLVEDDEYEFARRATIAVAHTPGDLCSPFYLFGTKDSGATQLACAAVEVLRCNNPDFRIECLTARRFAIEFTSAMRWGTLDSFRERFWSTDVLLIEDIEGIQGKVFAQLELLYVLESLHQRKAQVIIAADRAPSTLRLPPNRAGLASRLNSGMSIGLGARGGLQRRLLEVRERCDEWLIRTGAGERKAQGRATVTNALVSSRGLRGKLAVLSPTVSEQNRVTIIGGQTWAG